MSKKCNGKPKGGIAYIGIISESDYHKIQMGDMEPLKRVKLKKNKTTKPKPKVKWKGAKGAFKNFKVVK